MKLAVLVPCLCACGLLVAMVILFRSNQQKDAELANRGESLQRAEQMRQALEQLETTSAAQSNQLAELRVQQDELLRLRNEVRRLREENQQLAKHVQTAQAEIQRVQVQAQTAQAAAQRAQAQANQLADAQTQRTAAQDWEAEYQSGIKDVVDANGGLGTPEGQAAADCINNLHQIDGAKKQWALEKEKPSTDTPTWDDLRPYFGGTAQAISCPAGGTYSINVLSAMPTCSAPGHALPNRRRSL